MLCEEVGLGLYRGRHRTYVSVSWRNSVALEGLDDSSNIYRAWENMARMLKENNEIKPQDSTALQTEVMKDNIVWRMLVIIGLKKDS